MRNATNHDRLTLFFLPLSTCKSKTERSPREITDGADGETGGFLTTFSVAPKSSLVTIGNEPVRESPCLIPNKPPIAGA